MKFDERGRIIMESLTLEDAKACIRLAEGGIERWQGNELLPGQIQGWHDLIAKLKGRFEL